MDPDKSLKKSGSVTVTCGLEPKSDPRGREPLSCHKIFWLRVEEKLERLFSSIMKLFVVSTETASASSTNAEVTLESPGSLNKLKLLKERKS